MSNTKQKTAIKQAIDAVPFTYRNGPSIYNDAFNDGVEAVLNLLKPLEPINEQQIADAYNIGHNSTGGTGHGYIKRTF